METPHAPTFSENFQLLHSVPLACLFLSLAIAIVVPNVLTLVIVLKERLVKEAPRNAFLVNLLVSNVLGGIALALMACLYIGKTSSNNCLIFCHLNIWMYNTSTASLICLMTDQLIAIIRPFQHAQWMTPRVLVIAIVITWVAPSLYSVLFKFAINGLCALLV
jgi:hypothetical protein